MINISAFIKNNYLPVSPSWIIRVLAFTFFGYITEMNISICDSLKFLRNSLFKIAFLIRFLVLKVILNMNIFEKSEMIVEQFKIFSSLFIFLENFNRYTEGHVHLANYIMFSVIGQVSIIHIRITLLWFDEITFGTP